LLLLGDGPERAALEARAGALGIADAVAFVGFVDNPCAWMARASCVALSSIFEGFGNVLVEAMAVGTPVVSTDCPSGPAEVLEGGRFGRLVPPRDPAALAEAILATIDAPPATAILARRAAVFSMDSAVDAYQELAGLACRSRATAAPFGELRMVAHE
jgi:glycosyltransferase involved in cell wall biosynthesis